jgi:protein-S-isoprenylcysteine O-methyltransferase Ste14
MEFLYDYLIPGIWLAWGIYWLAVSGGVKSVARLESVASRAGHVLPLFIAALLLVVPFRGTFLDAHLLPASALVFFIGTGILLLGVAFMVWARITLGRNWSGMVTVKQDHELVQSGPYHFVRHPIYTGLLAGFLGTAVAEGEVRSLLAVLIVFAALWRKLRLEERWMGETFGPAYVDYKTRVAALIPYIF